MKTIRIFLASSINEFAAFRRQLKDIIEQRNKKYNPLGIAFDVIICEDESRHFSKGRKQEELNRMIQACDFFILLAGRDVGKATREEFDTACRCFRDSGPAEAPKIRAFFQNYPISETTPELRWFREHVREELEQYPDKFDHTAEVEREVLLELADSLAFSSSDQLEAGRRKQEEIAAEITKNRKEAAALCKDGVTAENLLEAAELYAKNAALSEESGMAWRTLEEYAAFLYRQGSYRRAIETAAKLDKHYGPADDPDERAGVKVLLGRCHMELDEYEAAEDFFRAALDLYRPLAEESPEDYAPDAAEVCVLLAGVMVKTFRLRAAERLYREALGLYLPCGLEEPEEYASWVGQVCHAL
ncbi:MAG: tetratricopeptide repeat protein, partial [Oscillibacter sp.]|nr:tetratricopeptide repeat protein [Oscillibacter sp.]